MTPGDIANLSFKCYLDGQVNYFSIRILNNKNKLSSGFEMMGTQLKVDIFHNVLWAKYKGDIFKVLLEISNLHDVQVNIFQIAETELSRLSLGKVNRDDHQYRYHLLFEGPYELIKPWQLWRRLTQLLLRSQSQVVVLPGYHRIEHWLMLLISKLRSNRVLVFCDSTKLCLNRCTC